MSLSIQHLQNSDINDIVTAFAKANWSKPSETFEKYLDEQQKGIRIVWLARVNNEVAGYVTLTWQSLYPPFAEKNIPEIMDLNVLPNHRHQGIATQLLDIAEKKAGSKSDIIGIGVGLYPDYGAAQKIYVKRGYIPDGNGITYDYQVVQPGSMVKLDDDLILWYTKKLK